MRRKYIFKPFVWLCLFFFLFSEVPIKKGASGVHLAPFSPFIQNQFIFSQQKSLPFVAASLLGLSLFFGLNPMTFLFPQFNSSVLVWAQEGSSQAAEETKRYLEWVLEDLRRINSEGMTLAAITKTKEKILINLNEIKKFDHKDAIVPLLQFLDFSLLDYGKKEQEEIYDALLETLVSILKSHKKETLNQLTLKRYWKSPDNYIPFYESPFNIGVGDIPKLLLNEHLRRLKIEVEKGVQRDNVHDFLSVKLAAQTFRLYVKAYNQELITHLDLNSLKQAVTYVKEIGDSVTDTKKYVKACLVLGLAQALAEIQRDDLNKKEIEESLKLFIDLEKSFGAGAGDFARQIKSERYFQSAIVQLKQRFLATIKLNPDAITPSLEKSIETKEETVQAPPSSPLFWLFLSLASFLAGGGWYLNLNQQKKNKSKKKPSRPLKASAKSYKSLKAAVNTTTAETTRFSESESLPLTLNEAKESSSEAMGPFILEEIIETVPEGDVRKAFFKRQNEIREIKAIKKGPFLMIYASSKEEGAKLLPDGTLLRKIYFTENEKWQSAMGTFKGNFAILLKPKDKDPNKTIKIEDHFVAVKIDEKTGKAEKDPLELKFLDRESMTVKRGLIGNEELEENLLISLKSNHLSQGRDWFWAFSLSQNQKIKLTRFTVDRERVYWITEKLGHGGMGEVYKAWATKTNRYVAIKINSQKDEDGKLSEEDKKQFMRESTVATSLEHPLIVRTYDYGLEPEAFIVMELLEGSSFDKVKEVLSFEQILEIGIKIGQSLEYVHKKGILHRDLKPANIFFDKTEGVKLTDFGLAKTNKKGQSLTATGAVIGTPAYMPPEQANGEKSKIQIPSDLYSLGAILYTLATGKPPYDGDTVMEILLKVTTPGKKIPMAHFRKDIPLEFEKVVNKAMAYKPERRYQTAKEMVDALKQLQENKNLTFAHENEDKKNPKIILGFMAVGVFFALVTIWKSINGGAREIKQLVPVEKQISPIGWGELKNLNCDEALVKLKEEIKKIKSDQNKAVMLYYQILLKLKEAQVNAEKENSIELMKSALQDLNEALEFNNIDEKTLKVLEELKQKLLELKGTLNLLSQHDSKSEPQEPKIFDPTPFDLAA